MAMGGVGQLPEQSEFGHGLKGLPALVRQLVTMHDAWVIGSAARSEADHGSVRDFDVVVPFAEWKCAALLIPKDAVPNTFGGWKCQSGSAEVDVWPGELGALMQNAAARYVWHPRSGARWIKA